MTGPLTRPVNLPPVISAGWGETTAVAALIAEALAPSPVAGWLVPNPAARPRVLRDLASMWVEYALAYGQIDLLDDRSASTIWIHRHRPVPPYQYHQRLTTITGPWASRVHRLDALLDDHHPNGQHHHLAFLAVAPASQRQGRGSALLAHHLRRLDEHGMPSYLCADSPRSRDFFQWHGYLPRQPFALPDGTRLWPMRRYPATRPRSPTLPADARLCARHPQPKD